MMVGSNPSPGDILTADGVEWLLARELGDEPSWSPGRVHGGGTTGSTNDDARSLAKRGADEGTTAIASRQTAGKGRLGRVWSSPDGGVYLSMILRPQATPEELAAVTLVIGMGIRDAIVSIGVPDVRLKWPNDIYCRGGKLAGILTETGLVETDGGERAAFLVTGVGMNVHRGPDAREHACYLDDVIDSVALDQVAAAEIAGIWRRYRRWTKAGARFAPFADEYNDALSLIGDEVAVRGMDGALIASGMVGGVDGLGRLLVGGEPVSAGEVTLRS